jgi:hypothetical protein
MRRILLIARCARNHYGEVPPTHAWNATSTNMNHADREDIKIDKYHCWRKRHHLIFIEEPGKYNGGMEELVCPGCQESGIFGPAYKCSIPKCTFFLHESCSEQLSHVKQHPVHPEHALFLQPPQSNYCNVCRKSCHKSLFYRRFTYDFDIDNKCVSRWPISANDCHRHSLFPMLKQMPFTCEACAEESNDIAYQCNDCRVLIHRKCAKFSRTIKTSKHDHSLAPILFVESRNRRKYCVYSAAKKVNTEYAVYYCQKCDYIVHMKCANYFKVEDGDRSETTDEVDANQLVHPEHNFDRNVIYASRGRTDADDCHQHTFVPILSHIQFAFQACGKEESEKIACFCVICQLLIHSTCMEYPRTINTSTHDHSLTLTYSLIQVRKPENELCKLCSEKVKTEYSAYCCLKCGGYIAHLECAYTVRDSIATAELVASNSIGYESHLVHLVEGINIAVDDTASPQEINHFSHPQHNLIFINEKLMDGKFYKACIQFIISTPFYSCAQCNFFLYYRCTKLPTTIKRELFHRHPLTLLSQDVNASGLFRCKACRHNNYGFVYRCDECE